jgi:plasmid stabilization system protein ParE
VPGLVELQGQVLAEVEHPPVRYTDNKVLHRNGIAEGIQGLAVRQRLAAAVKEFVVLFLDMPRIGQHHRAQVSGGRRAVDRAMEALLYQKRQSAAVVDVGVTQHHSVDPARIEGKLRVQGVGFGPAALKQAGIEQNPRSSRLEEVHRAGDLAGAAPEGQSGGGHPVSPRA